MNGTPKVETLVHPEHGEIPARRLLDCVFALTARGRILHLHAEQTEIEVSAGAIRFIFTASAPLPERARCQVIPPFVNAFKQPS